MKLQLVYPFCFFFLFFFLLVLVDRLWFGWTCLPGGDGYFLKGQWWKSFKRRNRIVAATATVENLPIALSLCSFVHMWPSCTCLTKILSGLEGGGDPNPSAYYVAFHCFLSVFFSPVSVVLAESSVRGLFCSIWVGSKCLYWELCPSSESRCPVSPPRSHITKGC